MNTTRKFKKYIQGTLSLLLVLFLFGSCTKKFAETNTDNTKITSVGPKEYPYMFSYALMSSSLSPDNFEIGEEAYSGVYSQLYTQAAHSFTTDRYVIVQSWLPAIWNPVYISAAPQLKTIMDNSDPTSAEYALSSIWWVWMFDRVTDYFGPIPYFHAAEGTQTVAYDPQDSIYYDFFTRLDAAVKNLKNHVGEKPFGTFDLVYGNAGDPVSQWIKFANTLRLRLALRLSKVDPALSQAQAEAAVAGGVMTDISDDAYMPKNNINYNEFSGFSVVAGWDDIRMSSTMASMQFGYNDPRMSIYFQPAAGTGVYHPARNGLYVSEKIDSVNTRLNTSNMGTRWCYWTAGGFKSTYAVPQDIMHSAEAYFLEAEGVLNGWNTGAGGTAQSLYEQGIRNSMAQWGVTDQTAVNTFVTNAAVPVAPGDGNDSPPVNDVPVAWTADPTMQRAQVAQQKWIALFPDGMEGWADLRRSGLPVVYPLVHSDNPDLPVGKPIRRLPFLTAEIQTNAAAVAAAVTLLGGPDNCATPLWWDKNN